MVTVDPVCYAVLAAYYSLLNLPLKCRKALRLADRYDVILFCMIEAVSHLPSLLPFLLPSYPLPLLHTVFVISYLFYFCSYFFLLSVFITSPFKFLSFQFRFSFFTSFSFSFYIICFIITTPVVP